MNIPKKIHYCWFGKSQKSRVVQKCIVSWKTLLGEYEIIEWNENNCDLSSDFVKYFYDRKKWAFVADYIRLIKLYEFGGIYLDTDMLVIKDLDTLLNDNLFLGAEDDIFLSAGIIGAKAKHPFIRECIKAYNCLSFKELDFREITIPKIITQVFKNYYNNHDNYNQVLYINDTKIYPKEYFYPYSYEDAENNLNYKDFLDKDTYTVHLWEKSWINYSEFYYIKKRKFIKGFKKMLYNIYEGEEKLNSTYIKMLIYSIKRAFFS